MVPVLITVSLPYLFPRNVSDAFIAQKAFRNDWPWWLNIEQKEKHGVRWTELIETFTGGERKKKKKNV